MGLMIEDGTGKGFLAAVDNRNRLVSKATTVSENKDINEIDEESYLYYSDVTPTATGDIFAYIKNNSNLNMHLNWYRIWSGASAEAIDIFANKIGTPAGTSTIVPSNMNITSSNQADGDFFEGVDITGLSGGKFLDRLRLPGNGEDITTGYPSDIIIHKGGVLTFEALTGAIAIELTLSFYYK